jgi:hypothetical protein
MKPIVLALAFAGLAFGQLPESKRPDGSFNCRFWNDANDDLRLGLIMGYTDGDGLNDRTGMISGVKSALKTALGKKTFGEMRTGVTTVCSNPENGILTIFDALSIFAGRVAGTSESVLKWATAQTRLSRSLPPRTSQSLQNRPTRLLDSPLSWPPLPFSVPSPAPPTNPRF